MLSNHSLELKETIKAEANNLGFCVIGFSSPASLNTSHFQAWLEKNHHAGMHYLADKKALTTRADARNLFPPCKTIISLGTIFPNPAHNKISYVPPESGTIAMYATGMDYHQVLDNKIAKLMENVCVLTERNIQWISAVDTKPLPERELAAMSGLGWIAKNGMLTNPEFGSSMFLCEILLDTEIPSDMPFEKDLCGVCTKCIDACPTQCIQDDRTINANKCISYLTIEHRGVISEDFFEAINESIFGCDICLQVCPWNQKANSSPIMAEFKTDSKIRMFNIPENIDKIISAFHRNYEQSAIRRAGKQGFLRNCMIRLAHNPNDENIKMIDEIAATLPETYLNQQKDLIGKFMEHKKGS